MQFQEFAQYLETLSQTTKRLEITAQLAQILSKLAPEEVMPACYLLEGRLTPLYDSLEFQLSTKMVMRALARVLPVDASGTEKPAAMLFDLDEGENSGALERVESEQKKRGDLGEVAAWVVEQKTQILTGQTEQQQRSLADVYQQLLDLAKAGGEGSQEQKVSLLVELFQSGSPVEAKYITRIILGKLRLGFSDMTLIDALSWCVKGDKSDHDVLEAAYQKRADIGTLAKLYLTAADDDSRQANLKQLSVEVGVPVMPALCQRLESPTLMIEHMTEVFAEPKYDGLRVQIHFCREWQTSRGRAFRTFTRSLEENTHMFPELESLVNALDCERCILDAEAIGFDPETGELRPFQETITRKRKHDVSSHSAEVPLKFFVFDVLALNEESLIDLPLEVRKQRLTQVLRSVQSEEKGATTSEKAGTLVGSPLVETPFIRTTSPDELEKFHNDCLADGLEGMVVKMAMGEYQSGRKGWNWVKIKETEGNSGKLSDTVDTLVMGYYLGRGKRAAFGIGAILVGVLAEDGSVKTVAKIGTGMTDEILREVKQRCDGLAVRDAPPLYDINKNLLPDVFVSPGLVIEVAADEITHSPIHTAKMALRFPRFVKFRDDKKAQDATTLAELGQITHIITSPIVNEG